MKKYNL